MVSTTSEEVEQGLPGSTLITPGSSIQGGQNDPNKHGEDNEEDGQGAIRACLDAEPANSPT